MQGPYNQAFEPLADLLLKFDHAEDVTSYRRSLDLDSALAAVSYQVGDCTLYSRDFLFCTRSSHRRAAFCQQTICAGLRGAAHQPVAIEVGIECHR